MALGRGLDALIPKRSKDSNSSPVIKSANDALQQVIQVAPSLIQVNPHQPRKNFNSAQLEELINSVKIHGIIQPLIVTKQSDGSYELIAGERRLRSAQALGLPTVPVIVREAKEQEKLELAMIENIQRKNLNSLEEAISYYRLIEEFNLTQEEVARRVGKSRSGVANTVRLLSLPEEVKQAIMDEKISEGHARSIAALQSPSEQLLLLSKILSHQLTVRETEAQVRHRKKFSAKGGSASGGDPSVMEFEEKLRIKFGTPVEIKKSGAKGEIKLRFTSGDDFQEIINKLLS